MKIKDIKEMTNDELSNKLKDLKTELFNLRFSHASGSLENPLMLKNIKKDIARIKTVIREREIATQVNG